MTAEWLAGIAPGDHVLAGGRRAELRQAIAHAHHGTVLVRLLRWDEGDGWWGHDHVRVPVSTLAPIES